MKCSFNNQKRDKKKKRHFKELEVDSLFKGKFFLFDQNL